jgi:integrase
MARKKKERGAWGQGYSVYSSGARWIGAVQISDQPRRFKRKSHPDQQAAETWCLDQLALIARGVQIVKGAQVLRDFASVWYNEVKLPSGLKPTTLQNYRARIESYILPILGEMRLDAIRPEDCQRFVNRLRVRGFAETTVRDVFNVLWAILETARKWRYIPENPADLIDKPRVDKAEPQPFSMNELCAILTTIEGHRQGAAFWTVATLGLRLGELLGVRWCDLNWEKAELTIAQQVQLLNHRDADGVMRYVVTIMDSPKTKAGQRTIPIPPALLERLRAHRKRQIEERLFVGPAWKDHDLLFPSQVGTPVSPRNFEQVWYRLRTKATINTDRNFHLFRHTVSTLMGVAGVIEEVRAAILGHSKKGITQYYTHSTAPAMRRATEAVEQMLLDALNDAQSQREA